MKKISIKIMTVGISVLLLPFIMTLLFSGKPGGTSPFGVLDFRITSGSAGDEEVLEFGRYLIGVVAANMPAGYELEALKAQAVIARTYALYNIFLLQEDNPGQKAFTTSELGLSYISLDKLEQYWGSSEYLAYFTKLENAVSATADQILTYDGKLILPVFFDAGTGYTRNAVEAWGVDIPYLVSVQSRQDVTSTHYLKILEFNLADLVDKLSTLYPDVKLSPDTFFNDVRVNKKDSTGYVTEMSLGSLTVSGEEFAKALGLNSNNFYLEEYEGKARFICTGSGHGIGLSQYGANAMALEGYSYDKILEHYYTGIRLQDLNRPD